MSYATAARNAGQGSDADRYQRHRPEQTLLYRIIEQHYPLFVTHLAGEGRPLPDYVQREFEDYLQCGRLEHGFLRVRCDSCHAEHLVAFSCKRRALVTKAARGRGNKARASDESQEKTPAERRAAMSLKRSV